MSRNVGIVPTGVIIQKIAILNFGFFFDSFAKQLRKVTTCLIKSVGPST